MHRVFVSNSQPIRIAGFDGKSVNRRLPVLDQTRALNQSSRSLPQARRIVGSGDENGKSSLRFRDELGMSLVGGAVA